MKASNIGTGETLTSEGDSADVTKPVIGVEPWSFPSSRFYKTSRARVRHFTARVIRTHDRIGHMTRIP